MVVSRSANAEGKLESLREELNMTVPGVNVTAISCDISNMAELKHGLDEYARARKPPIKGIIHGGMELRVSTHY